MDITFSINKIPIRLTDDRWYHISVGHPEIAGYYFEILECIEKPDAIYEGKLGELIAIKNIFKLNDKFVVLVYKEVSENDGFIITPYLSNKINEFIKRKKLWELQK